MGSKFVAGFLCFALTLVRAATQGKYARADYVYACDKSSIIIITEVLLQNFQFNHLPHQL